MKSAALVICGVFVAGMGAVPAQTPTLTSLPKTYGTHFQYLHVGAAEFRPAYNFEFSFDGFVDGYTYNLQSGNSVTFVAPVTLPPGAEIHALCAYLVDNNPDLAVEVRLRAARLIPGGLTPGAVDVGSVVASNWDRGHGVTCADFAPPYTYSEAASGEDGVALAHYFYAALPPSSGIGGVKIIWRRQVSPPPAAPTFGDVPANDSAFPFIEALAASGITAGCAGGNYCPDANLTRRQMAVFLAKALGLHWPN
jgi:S-layer homology domain